VSIQARWSVWWWPERLNDPQNGDVPVPYADQFLGLPEAIRLAVELAEGGSVTWIKVFRNYDEHDVRLYWTKERGYVDCSRAAAEILERLRDGAKVTKR
jgi:hypothetical protein